MRQWIRFPRRDGADRQDFHPRKSLANGAFEHEIGREGFSGPSAHLVHRHPPTGWSAFEGQLRPRAYDLNKLSDGPSCPLIARRLMYNAATEIRFWRLDDKMTSLSRNADGDLLIFVHAGKGDLFCEFGHMTYGEGDYLLLPRGTAWRLEAASLSEFILIEATGDYFRLPGPDLAGPQAAFDPECLVRPKIDDAFLDQQDENSWDILIKRNGKVSTLTYPYNPLDAVSCHGDLSAVRLNWRDIRPLGSFDHNIPAAAHATFVAKRIEISTFVPRSLEAEPGDPNLAYFHSNADFDEFIFYHQGEFASRDNIVPGMTTFHPSGFPHGPHPRAYAAAQKGRRRQTNEVALLVDSRDMLVVDETMPAGVEDKGYANSWKKWDEIVEMPEMA
jgi:homogentisate 1,2-dioxygenase